MEYIMPIMQDMIKFWNATNKPDSGMQHAFKLSNALQRKARLDGTAVVNPAPCTNKRMNKSNCSIGWKQTENDKQIPQLTKTSISEIQVFRKDKLLGKDNPKTVDRRTEDKVR